MAAPTAAHPSDFAVKTSLVRAFVVGLVYPLILIPIQPMIEPTFVWSEVCLGVVFAFLVAESVVRGWTPTWREYRMTLACAFVAQGVPLIIYELVTHMLLHG